MGRELHYSRHWAIFIYCFIMKLNFELYLFLCSFLYAYILLLSFFGLLIFIFFIVVQVQLSRFSRLHFPPPHLPPPSTLNPFPLWLHPCVLYKYIGVILIYVVFIWSQMRPKININCFSLMFQTCFIYFWEFFFPF